MPPPGFEDLSTEEKIAYVQALWDIIAARPDDVPVPDWHRVVIEERLAEARSSTADVRPWSEVRSDLQARLRAVRGG
jgi:putative addiction module component (TIGR02574 family)